jgi:hypothetical protein
MRLRPQVFANAYRANVGHEPRIGSGYAYFLLILLARQSG